jgi:hypothetical protein
MGRCASLPMRRKAMAMKLAAVRKPRAARLTCCRTSALKFPDLPLTGLPRHLEDHGLVRLG